MHWSFEPKVQLLVKKWCIYYIYEIYSSKILEINVPQVADNNRFSFNAPWGIYTNALEIFNVDMNIEYANELEEIKNVVPFLVWNSRFERKRDYI